MRRAIRIAAWSLAGLLLLALLLAGAVIVIGNTAGGRSLLERETASLTSGRVRIAGLAGAFPSRIHIAELSLSDSGGAWMTARSVSLRWSPLALLAWDLHVERFDVGRLTLVRRPLSARSSARPGRSTHLPVIDIDRASIRTLDLEPAAAGMKALLTVQGSLHYRSMERVRARLLARRTNGTGDYELTLHIAPSHMTGRLRLEEPAGGPIEHLVRLPGLGAVSVEASLAGPRNAEQLRLDGRIGALRARAAGTIDFGHRAAELTYSVASPAMMPRPDLSWRSLALEGRWRGPVSAPLTTGTLDVKGLRLPDGTRIGAREASLIGDGHTLRMHAVAGGIVLPGPHPGVLQDSPLDLAATLRLDEAGRPLKLTATQRLFSLRVQALTSGARSARFDLQLPDIAPLAALYHEDIGGTLGLSGAIAESGATTRLEVSGTGALVGSGVPARLLGAHATLRLVGVVKRTTAEVEHLQLSGRALSVTATGSAERSAPGAQRPIGAVQARWRIALPDLALISPSVAGSLEIRGTTHGPLKSLTAHLRVRSRLSLLGSPPGVIAASIQARGLPGAPSVAVRAQGEFDGAPLRLDGSLERMSDGVFHALIRRAQWKSLEVDGNLSASARLAAGRGSLRWRIGRLADLQPLLGRTLSGSVVGSATLTPGARRTRARIDIEARNLASAGFAGSVRLSGAGPLDALPLELVMHSPDIRGAPASLEATARLNITTRTLDLDRLEGRYRGQAARLLSPASVVFAGGLEVRHMRLGMQRAVLAVDGELAPALDCRLSIHHLDAALADAFVPDLLAQGSLEADVRLEGSRAAPEGTASLEIKGLRLANAAAEGLPAIDAHGSARLRGNIADVSAQLDAGPSSRFTLSGQAPLNATGAVALRLAGRLDAVLMNPILEARGERAAGTLTVDATVTGAARAPQIRGTVELANGDVRDYAEGIHLGDINARLVGGKGVLKIASLTARAGPGELTAQGTVGVLEPQMPIDVSISAHHIQPITSDILTANLDTRLRVAGTLRRRIDVSGTVHVNRASIMIPNGFPPNVATLEVIRPGAAVRTPPVRRRLAIGLGITLQAPDAIFVQGRGLDAQLGGRLELTGTSGNPGVSGGFSLVRGTFSLAGTTLNFNSGRVSFNGEGLKGRIDPTLEFLAQTSVMSPSPTTVRLSITGYADSPKIALSSSPPLPQDDLLGLLLFGKPASQLTALQLAQTGAALASLGGVGGGGGESWNPLTWIKKGLGLNTLSVGGATRPGATGGNQMAGASVTAGKYISNRVYVAATQTTLGTSQVRVDINLTRHVKLQTRLGNGTATAQGTTPENDPGSSIGLSYQIEY